MTISDRWIELTMLVVYLAVLLWIGIRAARKVKTSTDYALAGRNVPWIVVLATTAATMIGGGASVGYVAKVSQIGIAAAVITCAWHLQLIFTGLWVAPKLRGMNLITVGDYFQIKYGPLAREMAVVNCVIFLIGALAAQMAAIGTVANTILGVDYRTALLIGAAVTIFYSTVGGIRAVVSTDVLQFAILVLGIGFAAAFLFYNHGGFEQMSQETKEGHFALTSNYSPLRLISLFVAFLLGETFVPPYAVRCFIARDAQQAKWGVAGGGLFLLLFLPIATLTLGTAAQVNPKVKQALAERKAEIMAEAQEAGRAIDEKKAETEASQIAFPTLVRATFHPFFAGIIIAAIIAAVMSSGDSCLSCLSTVVMEDMYRRHVNPKAKDRQLLRVAQVTTLLAGIAAVVVAWYVSNIGDLLEFVYDFWAPTMVLPFAVAVFWYDERRIPAVVASMIGGAIAAVSWRFAGAPYDIGQALFGFVVAVVVFFVALPLTRQIKPSGWLKPGK